MIDKMNDFLVVFMGIFILLLIFLVFLLLAYVYHTYTTYTIDVNKNLETSEISINNTSNAFNKLQDNVINELAKVNKNQEQIVTTVPNNLISFSSNLLSVFALSSNNIKGYGYNDMINPTLDINTVNIVKPFTSFKTFTSVTDANNFLTICDNQTTSSDRSCIKMNVQDGIYNIYTSNSQNSTKHIKNINIYDNNNTILASFDTIRKNISLGSNIEPAISITNNVYTPNIIVGKCIYINANGTTALGTQGPPGQQGPQGQQGIQGIQGPPAVTQAPESTQAPAVTQAPESTQPSESIITAFRNKNNEYFTDGIAQLKLQYISNFELKSNNFINFPIINNFTIHTSGNSTYTYTASILKFKLTTNINANTITTISIPINILEDTSLNQTSTNGYITLS